MSQPVLGLIGGTGLGEALGAGTGKHHEPETPFGPPSGPILETEMDGHRLFICQRHGPGHRFNPTAVPYRANLFALKSLGVTHVLASGATGSLREHIKPRDLVLVDQLIDKTTRRPNTFYEQAAVHVEFSKPFCPVMRRWLKVAAGRLNGTTVHEKGTYLCMEGPAFSTEAESHMHRAWGGDLIGMTAMPEAKLAREAELAYALIALPTDYDCWRPYPQDVDQTQLLDEIIANVRAATDAAIELIRQALKDLGPLAAEPSPAHTALRQAIWTDKASIRPSEVQRLSVLWGRYFESDESAHP